MYDIGSLPKLQFWDVSLETSWSGFISALEILALIKLNHSLQISGPLEFWLMAHNIELMCFRERVCHSPLSHAVHGYQTLMAKLQCLSADEVQMLWFWVEIFSEKGIIQTKILLSRCVVGIVYFEGDIQVEAKFLSMVQGQKIDLSRGLLHWKMREILLTADNSNSKFLSPFDQKLWNNKNKFLWLSVLEGLWAQVLTTIHWVISEFLENLKPLSCWWISGKAEASHWVVCEFLEKLKPGIGLFVNFRKSLSQALGCLWISGKA